jgi:inorganic phosphate transporter, PiT family
MVVTASLVVVAVVFVVVCGANDGGAVMAQAIRLPVGSPLAAVAVLVTALLVGPLLFGLSVSHTFTKDLVVGHDARGPMVFLGGTIACVAVVWVLSWCGLPTSVTLAMFGGLAGAGCGLGVPPMWTALARVLAIGLLAPFAGAWLAYMLSRAARRVRVLARPPARVRLAIYAGQCLAYAVNDGQKMFAVSGVAWVVAHGENVTEGRLPVALFAIVALLFGSGTLLATRGLVRTAAVRLSKPRAAQLTSAQAASAAAVVGTAALQCPVSMTQAMAGGMVGTAISDGVRRVRWQYARPLAIAWVVTLPASFAAGLLVGIVSSAVSR